MKVIALITLLVLGLAVQGKADVKPVAHCWENDLAGAGGVTFYFGAISTEAGPVEIPSGPENYMSTGLVPPDRFWPDLNGFQRYVSLQPPAQVTWNIQGYQVSLNDYSTAICNDSLPQMLTIVFNATGPEVFPSLNTTLASLAIAPLLASQSAFDPHKLNPSTFEWQNVPNSNIITVTVTFQPSLHPSQYLAVSSLIALAGDSSHTSFVTALASAVSPNVQTVRLYGYGTTMDVVGSKLPPATPTAHPPTVLPPDVLNLPPIIPYGDCWERNQSGIRFYFGYNNTSPQPVLIEEDGASFIIVNGGPSFGFGKHFLPGWNGLAHAHFVPTSPIASANVYWYLLNQYVGLNAKGVAQECSANPALSLNVNIKFNGPLPTNQTVVNQTLTVVSQYSGVSPDMININIIGHTPPSWDLQITFANVKMPISMYAAAHHLHNAFYKHTAFPQALIQITGGDAVSLTVSPLPNETPGSLRTTPITPHTPPVLPPVHHGLAGGAIFGIILAVVAVIALGIGLFWYMRGGRVSAQAQGFERLIQ